MKTIPMSALIVALTGLTLFMFTRGLISFAGVAMMAWAAWAWWRADDAAPRAAKSPPVDYRSLMEPLKFKQIGKYSAIGLDIDNKIVHLYGNKQYRSYPFSDIRSWSANIQSGGEVVGGHGNLGNALAVTAANTRIARANRDATGFFVEVRDVDFPKWKIEFPPKNLQHSHDRWMEIFRQYVNET